MVARSVTSVGASLPFPNIDELLAKRSGWEDGV
jgi:hypothetical protein